jgi:hypothetical protein
MKKRWAELITTNSGAFPFFISITKEAVLRCLQNSLFNISELAISLFIN